MKAAAVLLAATTAVAAGLALAEPRSGIDFATPETRAMQADDTANPGMLWVLEGEQLWDRPGANGTPSCRGCHGEASASMRGVAARYPAFDAGSGKPMDLTGRVNACRATHQQSPPLAHEQQAMLALTAYVATQSRGLPMSPPDDPRLLPHRENGQRLFEQRMGQLDLSCANCHRDNADARLGGSAITQGQVNGYPLYRLEWQALGSLQRRLRNCLVGVRATPFEAGAPEMIDIELFLATRGAGLPVETPGVRP